MAKIPTQKEEKQPTAKIPTHKYNKVSPIGKNQIDYKRSLESNTLTIVRGPAGTGKTFLASVEAAELLRDGIIKNIVLVRPYVDLNNRGIGYLKGTEHEKLEPYVRPMLDAIKYVVGPLQLQKYLEEGAIEVKALASIRGMSYKETFLICDEMQGTVPNEIQALTTRIGKDSKMVIVGDTRQTDVRQGKENGLDYLIRIVHNLLSNLLYSLI
jgi:phosphate starvation-inducible PhoH-like protein